MDIADHYDLQLDATDGALEKLTALLPEMRLPAIHQAILSTDIANEDLPVFGASKLHFSSADLRDRIPGLTLGTVDATLPKPGANASASGIGNYTGTPFRFAAAIAIPTDLDGRVDLPLDLKVSAAKASLALNGTLALQTPVLAGLRPVLGRQLPALTDIHFDGKLTISAGGGPVRLEAVRLDTQQGVTTRKCSGRPVGANNAGTHAASSEGFSRSGLSRPGAG